MFDKCDKVLLRELIYIMNNFKNIVATTNLV